MGKVIVVGAGAAGLMAALFAAREGAKVLVIEKNARAGRKLALTGNGRGNITHWAEEDALIREIPGNGRFLYGALRRFGPEAVRQLFESLNVPTKVEADGRVFPCSDKASDVVQALVGEAQRLGVDWRWEQSVAKLNVHNQTITGVTLDNGEIVEGEAIVICTGGASYPQTGSTGDGYALAASVGHEIIPALPSLVPLVTSDTWLVALQGVSLRDTEVKAINSEGKTIGDAKGDLIFTHFGLSGPAVFRLSRGIVQAFYSGMESIRVSINLCPHIKGEEALDREVQNLLTNASRKAVKNVLSELLPDKLVSVILEQTGVDGEKPAHQLGRSERQKIVAMIRDFRVAIKCAHPLAEATVTMGGVSVKGLDPKSMGSRQNKGLYFAGEVVDVDGFTGGYNLQAAFSMGSLAGIAAADYVKKRE